MFPASVHIRNCHFGRETGFEVVQESSDEILGRFWLRRSGKPTHNLLEVLG
jgi:hypothetical protein